MVLEHERRLRESLEKMLGVAESNHYLSKRLIVSVSIAEKMILLPSIIAVPNFKVDLLSLKLSKLNSTIFDYFHSHLASGKISLNLSIFVLKTNRTMIF